MLSKNHVFPSGIYIGDLRNDNNIIALFLIVKKVAFSIKLMYFDVLKIGK